MEKISKQTVTEIETKQKTNAAIISRNFSDFFFEMAQLSAIPNKRESHFNWVKANTWPSGIFDIRMNASSANETLRDLVERMRSGQLPNTVMTDMTTTPYDYDLYFSEYGLERKYEAAGMLIDLECRKIYLEDIEDFAIVTLENENSMLEWSTIVCSELFRRPLIAEDFAKKITLTLPINKFKCFVGKYKNKIVATSFSYANNGVVGIYFVATKNEFRNLGFGTIMTKAPLVFAQNAGYKTAILQATPAGESVYEKIGFNSYGRFGRYRLE